MKAITPGACCPTFTTANVASVLWIASKLIPAFDRLPATFQRLELHSLDVDLDEVDARKLQRIQRKLEEVRGLLVKP